MVPRTSVLGMVLPPTDNPLSSGITPMTWPLSSRSTFCLSPDGGGAVSWPKAMPSHDQQIPNNRPATAGQPHLRQPRMCVSTQRVRTTLFVLFHYPGPFDVKYVTVEDPSPKPAFGNRDIGQPCSAALSQRLTIGVNEPVVLVDRNKLKQHDSCTRPFADPKLLLVGTYRNGRYSERS